MLHTARQLAGADLAIVELCEHWPPITVASPEGAEGVELLAGQPFIGSVPRHCRQGLVPPIVPLTLLKHHLNRHPVPDWVHQQVYLTPYPKELMLRNHV